MADKRISQLIERTDIANNDVLPIVASAAITTNKVTVSTLQDWMQDNLDLGVTSVGITVGSSGTDINVTGSPITTSGNITINIPTASATNRGLLSSDDWTTFNNKQDAGNFVTIDTAQTITGAKTFTNGIIVDGININSGGNVLNTFVGNSAGGSNTTGIQNTFIGNSAGLSNITGGGNSFFGTSSGINNISGSFNSFFGLNVASSLIIGNANTFIGTSAGSIIADNSPLISADNSVFLGASTKANANDETNQIVIGHNAIGQGSNTVTIGNSAITLNKLFGRLIHADAVNANESATLGQVNTSLGNFVTLSTAQTITATKTFSNSGSASNIIVNHTSGSGIALDITKAGNGEGIRVNKTGGSGNAATIIGTLEATTLVKTGGTSSQFLMADGSVNTNILPSGAYLPLTGGTLTGALNGTSASFTGAVKAGNTSFGALNGFVLDFSGSTASRSWRLANDLNSFGDFQIQQSTTQTGTTYANVLGFSPTGAATFSSSVTAVQASIGYTSAAPTNGMIVNGNVGIGTATPTNRLHVVSPAGGSDTVSGDFRSFAFLHAFQAGSPGFRIGYNETSKNGVIAGTEQAGGAGGGVEFWSFNGSAWGERMRITSDGFARLSTSSGGIQFNGDTAAANALDDYEEGTWTMGFSFGGGTTGMTYSFNTGRYTKIGRKVTVVGYVNLTNKGTSTGSVRITGLPFTITNSTENYSVPSLRLNEITFTGVFQAYGIINNTTISIEKYSVLGVPIELSDTDFTNDSNLLMQFTYFV
jgi:hypothetical protein